MQKPSTLPLVRTANIYSTGNFSGILSIISNNSLTVSALSIATLVALKSGIPLNKGVAAR